MESFTSFSWSGKGEEHFCLSLYLSQGRVDGAQDLRTPAQPSLPPCLEGPLCLQISGFLPGPYQLPWTRVSCHFLEAVTRPCSLCLSVHCGRAGPS